MSSNTTGLAAGKDSNFSRPPPSLTNDDAGHDEVGEVVERPAPDVEHEVEVRVLEALVLDRVEIALELAQVPLLRGQSKQGVPIVFNSC